MRLVLNRLGSRVVLTVLVAAFLLIAERRASGGLREWKEVRAGLGLEE